MTWTCDSFLSRGLEGTGDFLIPIDSRMERQNNQLLSNLTAWLAVLDALGWNVALCLPRHEPILSKNAEKWCLAQSGAPMGLEEIAQRFVDTPPARHLVHTPYLQVWAENGAETQPSKAEDLFGILTSRQREVLTWLREGKTGPEIAIILHCAPRTVESHIAKLYRKMGVRHRAQLLFQTDSAS